MSPLEVDSPTPSIFLEAGHQLFGTLVRFVRLEAFAIVAQFVPQHLDGCRLEDGGAILLDGMNAVESMGPLVDLDGFSEGEVGDRARTDVAIAHRHRVASW
jgi:hypothetical protein